MSFFMWVSGQERSRRSQSPQPEQDDALARRRELPSHGAPAGARPDDDHVGRIHGQKTQSGTSRTSIAALQKERVEPPRYGRIDGVRSGWLLGIKGVGEIGLSASRR